MRGGWGFPRPAPASSRGGTSGSFEAFMIRIAELDRLQQLDREIDAAEEELASIRAALSGDGALADLRARIVELEGQLDAAQRALRDAEDTAADTRAKLERIEQKLYGGTVQAMRELQDLQLDAEALRRQLREHDDRVLAAMSAVEEVETALAASREAQHADLEQQAEQLEARIAALRARRVELARGIDAPALSLYDQLRARWRGQAVARVERGVCLGCRMTLPTTLFNRARSGATLVQCSNCGRILYVA